MLEKTRKRGFTIVEMIVVLGIVSVLLAIVLPSLDDARKNARDKKRIADLKQLELAMEVYFDVNGYYPKESDGMNGIVGEGAGVDTFIASVLGEVPVDPLGPGAKGTGWDGYYYYYDGRQACTGGPSEYDRVAVLVAHMENPALSNRSDQPCGTWGGEGGTGGAAGANAYIILLGKYAL